MEEQERQEVGDEPGPGLLYHYTDQKGLSGIIDSGNIWATHFRFLNDTSERLEALDFITKSVDQIASTERDTSAKYRSDLRKFVNETFQFVLESDKFS